MGNPNEIIKKMYLNISEKYRNGFEKLKMNKEFSELADSGVSKKDKIRIMLQNWINVKRGYFTRWRIINAKLGMGLLRNDLKKDALNKKLMKMILSSTIGKMAYGMKLLKNHNDELNKLYGNKVDMVKRILNMFQTKTIIGLQNIALRKLKKNKIMNALLKSTVFQMNEMLQRLKEHRIKCLFDEKISDSVRQRIINNLCKNQERK